MTLMMSIATLVKRLVILMMTTYDWSMQDDDYDDSEQMNGDVGPSILIPMEGELEVVPHLDHHSETHDGHGMVYEVKKESILNEGNEGNTVTEAETN